MHRVTRLILASLFALILLFSAGYATNLFPRTEADEQYAPLQVVRKILPVQEKETVTLSFVGDIVPLGDSPNPFEGVAALLHKNDFTIGNLEGVLMDDGDPFWKCGPEALHCFSFIGNSSFADILADASFDLVSLANNHASDQGEPGRIATREILAKRGIAFTGGPREVAVLEKNGIKIAFVGAAPHFGALPFNEASVHKAVQEAATLSDVVVFLFHAGGEGASYANTPIGPELYLGSDRGDVRSVSHSAIDAGADIVIGTGPHVLRGIEIYNGKLIAYSLANFHATGALKKGGLLGLTGLLEVEVDKSGNIVSSALHSMTIDYKGNPHLDPLQQGLILTQELTATDFPSSGAIIKNNGTIEVQ